MPTIVQRATNQAVLLRFRSGAISGNDVFDPGECYWVPARLASQFVKGGIAAEVADGFEKQVAEHEIFKRTFVR